MKKIIIFLITVLGINIFSTINVKAANEFSFYEGDYIQGIWMTKEKGGTKYYQKARFFMLNDGTNRFAYCIEPFAMFNENGKYSRSLTANNLTEAQMKRISLIAYFGYTYGNHYDAKWYAVSQYMIWKEADKSGDIYFTDGLNGNKITAFTDEINEINNLIDNYLKLPSIAGMEIDLVEGGSISLSDTNNVLSKYKSDNPNVTINGNILNVSNLKEGEYTINLTRDSRRTTCIPFFYNSDTSQNMTTVGDVDDIKTSIKVRVQKTSLELTKVDSDTKTTTPSGDASLSGAIYQLYDANMNKLKELEIGNDMKSTIENLNYGKYFLKEIKAGTGYEIDNTLYDFTISKENPNINLTLENKVIKKEVELHKAYGDGIDTKNEENISFDIFNRNNLLFTTITTDNNGYASVILPFGIYTFKQKNTTEGYNYTDDFIIDVNNKDKEEIKLYDYKIKVPNTSNDNDSYIVLFVLVILGGIYVQKKIFY